MKTISIIILIILAGLLFSTPRPVPAEVLSQTKISDTNGLPQELLDYKDRLGVAVANIGDLDGGTDSGAVWICSYKSIRSSATNLNVAIPRFLEPNQDTPETHQPDYAPPLQRVPAFGGTNYILHQETFNGAHNWSTVDISGRGDFAVFDTRTGLRKTCRVRCIREARSHSCKRREAGGSV